VGTGAHRTVAPVRPEDARRLLGVDAGAGADELRAAYHRGLRATHPDLHGGSSDAAAAVVEAYRTLVDEPVVDEPPPAPPAPAGAGVDVVVDGDTVSAELPAGDLFAMLVEVAGAIGDVTYLDPAGGLLEVAVRFEGYGPCSVVLSLQGRATGFTEAWCTVETFAGGPAPPAAAVAELLAAGLRTIAA
jgi:hypothetical protein